ncbi:hypothetical protein [Endothiovibrio diazotrophicus]
MFGLFDRRPLLNPTSRDWLFDAFGWALEHFDATLFRDHTVLVQPNNRFFPGRADSADGMAELILERVKGYAGLGHWPTRAASADRCPTTAPGEVVLDPRRRADGTVDPGIDEGARLPIPYHPQQLNRPEGIIATFAHILAHYLGQTAGEAPPGGADYWPQATEVLAIYLGFGLMFANSAYTFRGGCGSCHNPLSERAASLTENEATYALALFAVLKGIPDGEVTGHLKGHLRGFYRRAAKEIRGNDEGLAQLREMTSAH